MVLQVSNDNHGLYLSKCTQGMQSLKQERFLRFLVHWVWFIFLPEDSVDNFKTFNPKKESIVEEDYDDEEEEEEDQEEEENKNEELLELDINISDMLGDMRINRGNYEQTEIKRLLNKVMQITENI